MDSANVASTPLIFSHKHMKFLTDSFKNSGNIIDRCSVLTELFKYLLEFPSLVKDEPEFALESRQNAKQTQRKIIDLIVKREIPCGIGEEVVSLAGKLLTMTDQLAGFDCHDDKDITMTATFNTEDVTMTATTINTEDAKFNIEHINMLIKRTMEAKDPLVRCIRYCNIFEYLIKFPSIVRDNPEFALMCRHKSKTAKFEVDDMIARNKISCERGAVLIQLAQDVLIMTKELAPFDYDNIEVNIKRTKVNDYDNQDWEDPEWSDEYQSYDYQLELERQIYIQNNEELI